MTFLCHILSTAPVERIGWTLLHSLWQFALLAVLLAGVLEVLRRRSANLRYLVGCFALAAMLAVSGTTFCLLPAASPPMAGVSTPTADVFSRTDPGKGDSPIFADTKIGTVPTDSAVVGRLSPPDGVASIPAEPPATDATAEAASAPLLSTIGEALSPWLPWITVLWLSGVVLLSLRNLAGWIGVQRLRRVGTAPVCQELADRARAIIARMKISRPVRILQSTLVEIPIVAGWLTPMILPPVSILAELSPQQLEAILAHELAHIRRHDYLINLLQTVAETLLFYHPAVWWVSRRIRIEREHCCDDAAVRVCGDNLGLGEALTLLEASRLALAPVVAIAGNRSGGTLGRVRRLLDPTTESIGFSKASAAVVVLVLLALAMTAGWGHLATAESETAEKTPALHASKIESAWGKAVQGVQCRLRPEKSTWKAGQTPQIVADLRNRGQRKLTMDMASVPGDWEVQYDGVWYRPTMRSSSTATQQFVDIEPEGRRDGISLMPDDFQWKSKEGNRPLEFRAGKHILRASFHLKTDDGRTLQVESNSVEIEIVEKDGATTAKSSPSVWFTTPEKRTYLGEGRIADDMTGKPLEQFLGQACRPDPLKATAENRRTDRWVGEQTSPSDDRVGQTLVVGSVVSRPGEAGVRVYANVALPQHIPIVPENGATGSVTGSAWIKPGRSLRGRVLDHEGKPVENAQVFFRGPGSLRIENGHVKDNGVGSTVVLTDENGRFTIAGGGKERTQVIVLAPHLMVWTVPMPKEGSKEVTIRLPKPATLKIVVDLPGATQGNERQIVEQPGKGPHIAPAGKGVSFRLEMENWKMPGWKDTGDFTQTRTAANPGEVVFENLTPGSYDFSRTKMLSLGDRGQGAMCDRQLDVKLLPGESKTIRLVRKRGQRVGGAIHGLPKDMPGAFITVHPAEYSGDPQKRDEWKLPEYDALTCENDKHFLTGLLEPGRYKIVAEGYRTEPRTGVIGLGWRMPDFVGMALVTVEDDDPANPKKLAPQVTIDMKPRKQRPMPEKKKPTTSSEHH